MTKSGTENQLTAHQVTIAVASLMKRLVSCLFQIASCTIWRTHLASILSKHRIYYLTSFSGIIVRSKLRIVCIFILEINWKHVNVNELLKNQKFWKKMSYWELLITQTSCWCLVFFISIFNFLTCTSFFFHIRDMDFKLTIINQISGS